jgi:hypothetical protein
MSPPDPVILEGPPAPDFLAQIVPLKDPQREQYATLHQRFMTSTQRQRDSLRAVSERLREDWTNRDRVAGREGLSTARQLRDELSRQQGAFDEWLKGLLDKDQWKKVRAMAGSGAQAGGEGVEGKSKVAQ